MKGDGKTLTISAGKFLQDLDKDALAKAKNALKDGNAVLLCADPQHDPDNSVQKGRLKVIRSRFPNKNVQSIDYYAERNKNTKINAGIYSQVARASFIVFPSDNSEINKAFSDSIRAEYYRWLHEEIISREKDAWTVLIDETGIYREGSGTLLAVIKPPGVSLPPAPPGYHAVNAGPLQSAAMRRVLADNPSVGILGLRISSPRSSPLYNRLLLGRDDGVRAWSAALFLLLEYIAAHSTGYKRKIRVFTYLENRGHIGPQNSLFDATLRRLLEGVVGRNGWMDLNVQSPAIIAKDDHPYLAYADTIGPLFSKDRPHNDAGLRDLAPGVRENSHLIEIGAEDLESIEDAVASSGRSPERALSLAAGLSQSAVRSCERVLAPLVDDCLMRLSVPGKETLMKELRDNLVERPRRYAATAFVCSRLPEGFAPAEGSPELRCLTALNALIAGNHSGDEQACRKALAVVDDLAGVVRPAELRYRCALGKADFLANGLRINEALDVLRERLEDARRDRGAIETASHLLSQYAQFAAFSGESEKALGLFNDLYKDMITGADRQRLLVYMAHARYDLGDLEAAWTSLDDAVAQGACGSYEEACSFSQYLRACVLKLNASAPRLKKGELIKLFALPYTRSFPWEAIMYWSWRCAKSEGLPSEEHELRLAGELTSPVDGRSDAVVLIRSCFSDQARSDGISVPPETVPGAVAEALRRPNIAEWLVRFPQKPTERYGMLAPLLFYYR